METNHDISHEEIERAHPEAWSAWTRANEDVTDDVFSTQDGRLWVEPGVPQSAWYWDAGEGSWRQEDEDLDS